MGVPCLQTDCRFYWKIWPIIWLWLENQKDWRLTVLSCLAFKSGSLIGIITVRKTGQKSTSLSVWSAVVCGVVLLKLFNIVQCVGLFEQYNTYRLCCVLYCSLRDGNTVNICSTGPSPMITDMVHNQRTAHDWMTNGGMETDKVCWLVRHASTTCFLGWPFCFSHNLATEFIKMIVFISKY